MGRHIMGQELVADLAVLWLELALFLDLWPVVVGLVAVLGFDRELDLAVVGLFSVVEPVVVALAVLERMLAVALAMERGEPAAGPPVMASLAVADLGAGRTGRAAGRVAVRCGRRRSFGGQGTRPGCAGGPGEHLGF